MPSQLFAQTQANSLDNIAPTTLQAKMAREYSLTDHFLNMEEQSTVLQREIDGDRPLIKTKLHEIGISPALLATRPEIEKALFSGRSTPVLSIQLPNDLAMQGRLRVEMTEHGARLRVTPVLGELKIPDKVGDLPLTPQEKQDLQQQGFLERPLQVSQNGSFVPAYLRVDSETNTVSSWKVRPDMLPNQLFGIQLTREQQLQLAAGYSVQLIGLKDPQGDYFEATVAVSVEKQGLRITSTKPMKLQVRPGENPEQQLIKPTDQTGKNPVRKPNETSVTPSVDSTPNEKLTRLLSAEEELPQQHRIKLRPS